MPVWICRSCGVEHAPAADPPEECAICADDREDKLLEGPRWTTPDQLRDAGHETRVEELEPDLYGIRVVPRFGIGQRALLVRTPEGNLLWDPTGYLDRSAVERVRDLGGADCIVASHPHMYGVQIEWSRALGGIPVLVAEADRHWLQRSGPEVEYWTGRRRPLPGLTLHTLGGHFPGSAVVHWPAGAQGRGVLLSGDTLFVNPDRRTVAFMRSYVNPYPLSAAVVERIAGAVGDLSFDRIYANTGGVIDTGAREAVHRSARRHVAWVRGDHDDLT
ncbi:MBL fold metallo-hydrolase [Kocuria sp. M1R5S2]|uniref:MBL fold metallo-hydrolase n=1 Tax=Kocuria rhizosphaerae TaxID=3376285 RepID=UPI00378F37C6